ncbi:MAG: DUF3363 domain-containing protein [Pseudomonadota bacterium]
MSEADDYLFQPRLGRIASQGSARVGSMKAYLKGAKKRSRRSSGSRSGATSFAGMRRVMIKARVHRLSGTGGGRQRAHISYLERDGAGKDRKPAEFYNDIGEEIDGQDWLKHHSDERHHFRFIVSPEDGEKLQDLKPFVRDLISQMEIDLETKLDWIAVDHYNTEHPHTHIVMSGKRDDGKDLVIPRDYLSHGMRERGGALLTRELGLQTEQELSAKLSQETHARKLTRLDRILLRENERTGRIDLSNLRRNRNHYETRLKSLRDLGLAQHQTGSVWSLDEQLKSTLHALERSDAIATRIEQGVAIAGLERVSAHEQVSKQSYRAVRGQVLTIGHADELMDSRYAIVDGFDGRAHHFALGTSYPKDLKTGDWIEVKPRSVGVLEMDRLVAEVARQNSNVYSERNHRRVDPSVSDNALSRIQNRIGALEYARLIDRSQDGSVMIDDGFIDRVDKHFAKIARQSPSIVRKLESQAFRAQVRALGETWLDRQLAGIETERLSEAGLGGEIRDAKALRLKTLFERGHIERPGSDRLTDEQLKSLQREGMAHVAKDIAQQTGLQYRALGPGENIEGTLTKTLKTPHAKYGVVEHAKEFTLVPWKDGLERMRRRQLEITMSRGMDLSWQLGRSRGLGR